MISTTNAPAITQYHRNWQTVEVKGLKPMKTKTNEIICPSQESQMFESDFRKSWNNKPPFSLQDRKFLVIINLKIQCKDNWHQQISLRLKENNSKLPNNRELTLNRLNRIKQRLKNDARYRAHYQAFIKKQMEKGTHKGFCQKNFPSTMSMLGTYHIVEFSSIYNPLGLVVPFVLARKWRWIRSQSHHSSSWQNSQQE